MLAAACGGGGSKPAETAAPEIGAPETTAPSQPAGETIVIEYGDFETLKDLASKAQNFDVAEGTVATIDGIFSEGVMMPSIMEDSGSGSKFGMNMYIEDDAELPAEGTDVTFTGTFVKGNMFMEFHVKAEDIIVK